MIISIFDLFCKYVKFYLIICVLYFIKKQRIQKNIIKKNLCVLLNDNVLNYDN